MRRLGLGVLAAALGSISLAGASSSMALTMGPDIPLGWDYTPGRTRNGQSRTAGSRAHRRWRKRRAAGRA